LFLQLRNDDSANKLISVVRFDTKINHLVILRQNDLLTNGLQFKRQVFIRNYLGRWFEVLKPFKVNLTNRQQHMRYFKLVTDPEHAT
jgi:hypothetical protein